MRRAQEDSAGGAGGIFSPGVAWKGKQWAMDVFESETALSPSRSTLSGSGRGPAMRNMILGVRTRRARFVCLARSRGVCRVRRTQGAREIMGIRDGDDDDPGSAGGL